MKIAVIGIGLIGGSLARDIRLIWDQAEIIGLDVHAGHVQQAIELGFRDFHVTSLAPANTLIAAPRPDMHPTHPLVLHTGGTRLHHDGTVPIQKVGKLVATKRRRHLPRRHRDWNP